MSKKITLEEVDQIIQLQNQLAAIYEKQKELQDRLAEEYGEGVHYFEHRSAEHPWIKIELIDNIATLQRGEEVWKHSPVAAFTWKTTPLKRKPKQEINND